MCDSIKKIWNMTIGWICRKFVGKKPVNKVLKTYYEMSEEQFGISVEYTVDKTEIDFIRMLKECFEKATEKDSKRIKIDKEDMSIFEFETYIKNEIDIYEDRLKYGDITMYVLLLTIVSSFLVCYFSIVNTVNNEVINKIVNMNINSKDIEVIIKAFYSNFNLLTSTIRGAMCIMVIIITIIFGMNRSSHKEKIMRKRFFKLSLEILQQVKTENIYKPKSIK